MVWRQPNGRFQIANLSNKAICVVHIEPSNSYEIGFLRLLVHTPTNRLRQGELILMRQFFTDKTVCMVASINAFL